MKIKIKNLRLRTLIGIYDWERKEKQDVIINAEIETQHEQATKTDNIADAIDYKTITKRIIGQVESAEFFLIEKLAKTLLEGIMQDPKILKATLEIDKPHALRFADSVSVILSEEREK